MKNFTKHLLLAALLIATKLTFGQGFVPTGISSYSSTYTSCDSILSISLSAETSDTMSISADVYGVIDGTGFVPCNLQASVSWGDGTFGTYTAYASSPGSALSFSPAISHMFPSLGTYAVLITITNLDNNMSASDTLYYTLSCGTPMSCFTAYVFCDANADGQYDSSDEPVVNAPVIVQTDNGTLLTAYSDSSGWVILCTADGSSEGVLTIDTNWFADNGYAFIGTNYSAMVSTTYAAYFGVDCSGVSPCADLHTSVMPWTGYYQNTTNVIRVNYGNNGSSDASSVQLTLTFPAGVTPVTSSITIPGYTISGNTITWNLSSVNAYYYYTDYITFSVPGGISNGTIHQYIAQISADSPEDCNAVNDSSVLIQVVGNSYDPNEKTVDHATNLDPAQAEYLTYTIQFQNTGTAPAQDIYVIDTLSANLDWSTLEIIETSHTMQTTDLGNGVKKFSFSQIWLPDAASNEPQSHGFVTYRVKENNNLSLNSWIFNTAYIYFDANEPIVTNTTANVNAVLDLDEETMADFHVYPNPSSSDVTIQFEGSNAGLRVLDLAGKVLVTASVHSGEHLSLEGFQSGVYLFEVTIDGSSSVKRVVKR